MPDPKAERKRRHREETATAFAELPADVPTAVYRRTARGKFEFAWIRRRRTDSEDAYDLWRGDTPGEPPRVSDDTVEDEWAAYDRLAEYERWLLKAGR